MTALLASPSAPLAGAITVTAIVLFVIVTFAGGRR